MRLIPDDSQDKEEKVYSTTNGGDGWVDLYLPPLSLYVLTGVGRFNYSHQLLPDKSQFTPPDGQKILVPRKHRLSVIFRDTKVDNSV